MSFSAQCPTCGARCVLAANAIGHRWQCKCGAHLFACDGQDFDKMTHLCEHCGKKLVAGKAHLGRRQKCGCGEKLVIPTARLLPPLTVPSTASSPPQESLNQKASTATSALPPDVVAASTAATQTTATDDKPRHQPLPHRERSVAAWLGWGAIALLLVGSLTLFLLRNVGRSAKQATTEQVTPSVFISETPQAFDVEAVAFARTAAAELPDKVDPASLALNVTGSDPATAAADKLRAATSRLQKRKRVAPALRPLAVAAASRPVIPIVSVAPETLRGWTYDKAYEEAFGAYQETLKRKRVVDEAESVTPASRKAFETQLGETIGLLQATYALAVADQNKSSIAELRYLLAFTFFLGGHLPEAAIFGEAAGRWSPAVDPSTREAMLIALTACQEMHTTHWADPQEPSELQEMEGLGMLLAKRFPDDEQIDAIWFSTAQMYEQTNHLIDAARCFQRLSNQSEQWDTAQLAAGMAYWTSYLRSQDTEPAQAAAFLKKCEPLLVGVAKRQERKKRPSESLVFARLTLAQLALEQDQPGKAIKRLTDKPFPLDETLAVDAEQMTNDQLFVSVELARAVWETLSDAHLQAGDQTRADEVLVRMRTRLGETVQASPERSLTAITERFRMLLTDSTVSQEQVVALEELLGSLKGAEGAEDKTLLTIENELWIAEAWVDLSQRAISKSLSNDCLEQAIAHYTLVLARPKRSLPMRTSARLHQSDLLHAAGEYQAALEPLTEVLRQTPNRFDLQIKAALLLEHAALAGDSPSRLREAIYGPTTVAEQALWGWNKLVKQLHAVRFSDIGTSRHAEQLRQCQYHLASSRWLLATSMHDGQQRQSMLRDIRGDLQQILSTTGDDAADPWSEPLRQLKARMEQL